MNASPCSGWTAVARGVGIACAVFIAAVVSERVAQPACTAACRGALFFSSGFDETKRWYEIRRPKEAGPDDTCHRIWITDVNDGPCTETGDGSTWKYREICNGSRPCNPNGGVVAWADDPGTYMVIGPCLEIQCWTLCEAMCP